MARRKLLKVNLLVWIIVAIALGIMVGSVVPNWLAAIFMTFNACFSQFLGFIIPLLIAAFVAPAIADIGKKAGKMLIVTALLAYVATMIAGISSYGVGAWLFPSMIGADAYETAEGAASASGVAPYFTIEMPPVMTVMSALVLAFVLGLGTARLDPNSSMKQVLDQFRTIVQFIIMKAIIPCLPLYIFGIFMDITISGQVATILITFSKIIIVIFVLHIAVLVFQYLVASLFMRKNPFKMLWAMTPAYFTALGTQSSAATIPVTLESAIKMGVRPAIAGFVIPLCATIHMSGSTLKIVACALALMITGHMPYDFPMFMAFIAMLGITIIAAPGVPGGAIMASLGLLSSILGFSEVDNAMMIALYITMDSFGTACNVTGDGALAAIINRIFPGKDETPEDAKDLLEEKLEADSIQ